MFKVPEKSRVRKGTMASDASYGNNGAFAVKAVETTKDGPIGYFFLCVASDAGDWEHVNVTVIHPASNRQPTWDEMCAIKNHFWDKDDVVYQIHPAESKYNNPHPMVLHLWKHKTMDFPVPPPDIAGLQKKSAIILAGNAIVKSINDLL